MGFLRGWQVPAEGGNFTVVEGSPNRLDVYTARSKNFVTYSEDGTLIDAQHYEQEFAELPQGSSQWVPTPWYLLPFSSPFGSWALAVIGAGGMELLRRFASTLS